MKTTKYLTVLFLLLFYCSSFSNSSYPFEVKVSGQGKHSIIFIPGFACSGDVWQETLDFFEKDFRCYTLTMAGFAGVEPQPNSTFNHWKSEIARYISDKKIIQPILIGHSMGGALAMAIAADYPDSISKIVVVDALPALAALTDPNFKTNENLDCSTAVHQFKDLSDESFYTMQKSSIPKMLANIEMQPSVLDWSMASDRETFARMYCDLYNTDLREKLSTITCPSLILLESYFINFNDAIEEQYTNLQSAQLEYANKGLHFIMYDDKEWYFSQLDEFIKVN